MMGSSEYISAFLNIILPVSYDFDPDLIFVSAGFDAAINDPLGHYHVLPEAYGHFIHQLMSLAQGRVIIALEVRVMISRELNLTHILVCNSGWI